MTRNIYALLVGIDDYPNEVGKLEGCVNDIRAIEHYLKTRVEEPEKRLQIRCLINQQATRQAVIDGFEKHLSQADKDDVVLFYYSGHGSQEPTPPEFSYSERDGKLETLVCWDSRTSARDLANKELRYLIAKVAEHNPHILLVLDCCHSGSGSRDVEQKQKLRHTPAYKQARKINEFIFADDAAVLSQKHGDGWDLPEGRHILLAACQDRERASEYSGDGQTRGAFSYFLLDALNKAGSNLSYREFFKEVSSRVRSRIKDQTPRLEANHAEDLDNLSFLGGSDIIKPRELFFTLRHNGDNWEIDGGAVHGLPKVSSIPIKLALYSQRSTLEQIRQLSEPDGEVEVIDVLPDKSIVKFTKEPTNLTEDTILKAIAITLPPPTIGIYLEGDPAPLELVRQQLQKVGPGEKPSLYIREEHELTKAQYCLLTKDGRYVITKPSDDRPLVEPLKGYDKTFRAVKNLEHIARWTTTIDLANPESQIPANAVKVQIYRNGKEVQDSHLRLKYEYKNGKWQQPTFQVKLTNTYDQRLFCAILDVAEDYSVSVPRLFPQGELAQNGGLWIEPKQEVWAGIWNGNRKMQDHIPASVPDEIWKQGVTEYQDVFKLIISTAEFDATLLCQDDLSSSNVELSGGRRELPSRLNTLNLLMYQIQSRQFGVVKEIDDWVTSQFSITTVRPKDAVSLNHQVPTDLSFGVTILPHSGLRANVRLSSVPPSTRDIGNPTLPLILGDYTQPFQFTASRGVDSGLSVLELQVNDNDSIGTVTPENPLVLSVNKSITQDEYILPVAHDGKFWLPLGQGKGKDGNTEIRIERLPTLDNEQISGEKKRSLGGSILIYFQKIIYENLGHDSPYPKLRVARVAEDGTINYEEDHQQIKVAVQKAQRIVIYIHGIIGDTESMVPSVRQAKVKVNGQSKSLAEIYDLVLTFDYESLNTPIKELGKQLRDKLAAVGLTPNHGKTLHIIAHSMGGLVSRSFIEQSQGNQVVQHLIMLGTPNAGSPWSAVQDLATFALGIVLNPLSSVIPPAKLLGDLVALIEKIDINLDEMHPTKSQFLKELKDCADPQCPYSIIAGNTSLISEQKEAINQLYAALKKTWHRAIEFPFMGEVNDIAVTVKSIINVPQERSPEAYIQDQVACNHLLYFRHPAGLDALARAVARAFPDYSGSTTLSKTPLSPPPIAPGDNPNPGKENTSLQPQSPQPPEEPLTSQSTKRAISDITAPSTSKSESGFENSYAVVIGINDYHSGIPPLRTAVNDAKKIAEILESEHEYTLISPSKSASGVENKAWLDGDATRKNLKALLETLEKTVGSDDRLLFYFAGHGIAINSEDGPQGFLIPQDAELGNTKKYLPMSELRTVLAELPCRHCLIILDCCYSGAFRWSSTRQFGHVREIFKDNYDLFIHDPAWQVITSSAHDQKAADEMVLENNRDSEADSHSPFANALINGLKNGTADTYPPAKDDKPQGDGIITADELYQYVRYQIELETAQRNKRQTPGLWIVDEKHDKGVYVFLTKHFDKTKLPPAPTLEDTKESNPYRGLESYEEEHSQLFFGRTKLIEELCDRVCERPLTVVLGASGSGKSSLVKAGLIPHLKRSPEEAQQLQVLVSTQDNQNHRHKHEKWNDTPILINPGTSPVTAWENALKEKNLDSIPAQTKFLLVIDQFEELVTQCREQDEREKFLQKLAELLKKYSDRLRIVLTLRSDFESQLRDSIETELKKHKNLPLLNAQLSSQSQDVQEKLKDEERIWNAARFIVPPMTREELQEAIEAPAATKAILFDSQQQNNRTLVQQLIHEVADMPGALPLLSFALSELYRKLAQRFIDALKNHTTPDRTITWDDYNEIGGVTRSLTRRATEEYDKLAKDDKDQLLEESEAQARKRILRWVMLRMVAFDSGEIARRRVLVLELEYPDPQDNKRCTEVIKRFSDARLLVQGKNLQGQDYVEPAHDALVREWEKVRVWLDGAKEQSDETEEKTNSSLQSQKKQGFGWKLLSIGDMFRRNKQSKQKLEKFQLDLQRDLTDASNRWQDVRKAKQAKLASQPGRSVNRQENTKTSEKQNIQAINRNFQKLDFISGGKRVARSFSEISQWLWWDDPRLPLAKEIHESSDNWLNAVETYFLQESITTRGTRSTFWQMVRWGVTIVLAIAALVAWYGQEQAKIQQIRALRQSSEANLRLNQNLDALMASLQAGKVLKESWLLPLLSLFKQDGQLKNEVTETLQKAVYSVRERNRLKHSEQAGKVTIRFSPDGQLIATAGDDGSIALWNLQGKQLKKWQGEEGQIKQIKSIDFSHKNQLLATAGDKGIVRLWNFEGQELDQWDAKIGWIQSISFSKDGRLLAIAGGGGTVIWNLQDKSSVKLKEKSQILSVNFSQDSQFVATAGGAGTVSVWNLKGKKLQESKNYRVPLRSVSFSPDSQFVAVTGDWDVAHLWNWKQGSDSEQKLPKSGGLWGGWSISFGPANSQYLAIARNNGFVYLFDWKESDVQANEKDILRSSDSLHDISFSPEGNLLATAGDNGNIALWNLQPGQQLVELKANQDKVKSVTFSSNGQTLATTTDSGTVRWWTLQGEVIEDRREDVPPTDDSCNLKERGLKVIKGLDKAFVRDLENNLLAETSKEHINGLTSISCTVDGKLLATVGSDYKVRLWDLSNLSSKEHSPQSLTPVKEWTGDSDVIDFVQFSQDGKQLAIGGRAHGKGRVRLWNLEGKAQATWETDQGLIKSISFSQDGKLLATVGERGNPKLLPIESFDKLMERSCNWVREYLATLDEKNSDRHLCDGINQSEINQPQERGEISIGNKILLPSLTNPDKQAGVKAIAFNKKILLRSITNPDKQAGVKAIASRDFDTATERLKASLLSNPNDPETRIYLNNAEIGSQESYTIAVSVPLNDLNISLEILRGVAQAQELYNKWVGTTGGREVPFKVLIADDRNKPEVAQAIAKQLADNPNVLGVVGHFSSDVTREAAKIYNDRKLVAISPVSTSVELSNDVLGRYVFRTVPSDKVAAKRLAEYMLKSLNKTKAVVFYNQQSEYSKSLSSEFESAVTSKNGQVKLIDLSDSNFMADQVVERSIQQGAEVLVLMPSIEKLDKALEVIKANKNKLPLLAGDDVYGPVVLEKAGKEANGMVVGIPWHIGANRNTEFSTTSTRLWKGDVNWRTAMAYDAAKALIAAIRKEPTREGVAKMIRSESFTANGSSQNVAFLPSGDRKDSKIQLVKVKSNPPSCPYKYIFVPEPLPQNNNPSSSCH